MRTLLVFIISFTAWLQPLHAVSAFEQTNEIDTQFINYEQFHRSNAQSQTSKTSGSQSHKIVESGHGVQNSSSYSGRHYNPSEVEELIKAYSTEYRTDYKLPLAIARCESGLRWNAANPSSSARGVFQWLKGSWSNQPASLNGTISPFDADRNVSAAVWLIAHGKTSPWDASKHCWNK